MPTLTLSLRARLTLWYVGVLAVLLIVYATLVFGFQYAILTRQMFHDEVQDAVTAEGLLYFDSEGQLQLQQNYYSRPQSHLLIDRLMEVRDLRGEVLYRSPALHGMLLDGPLQDREGDTGFNQRIVRLSDGSHAMVISHIHTLQGTTVVIRLGYSLTPFRERMIQFLLLLLVAVPLALIIAGAAGQMIAARGLRPVKDMAERAKGITANNLHDRLKIRNRSDELGQLAAVFNHLLERLEQAFQQMRRFTADAAHELRTPLASIRTVSEVALEQEQRIENYRDALSSILEEVARLNETINGLLLLARAEATQPEEAQTDFSAKELVHEVLTVLGVLIEEKQITVCEENQSAATQCVRAERNLLRVAIMNVLHNALKFSPSNSILTISYGCAENRLTLTVQDQGPGIPPADSQRVFDRFYTNSSQPTASHCGTGLGLSIARVIIDRVGGTIGFEASKAGARCCITLPLVSEVRHAGLF
jgi:heavy metal sensor kinase